jgi:hypothetical protein
MTQIARFDSLRSINKGYVAKLFGETYDVRRVDASTNDWIMNNTPVYSLFQARIWRETSRTIIEATPFDLVIYIVDADNTTLQLGDLLTESVESYKSLGASYYYVQARPTRELLFARAEFPMTIWRPHPEGGAADQFPDSGSVFAQGYGGTPKSSELVLTLAGGTYSWEPTDNATPAVIQCGIQPQNRTAPSTTLGTPTDEPRDRFAMYVPLLPGAQLRMGDRVTADDLNSTRYEVLQVFSAQQWGFWGSICSVQNVND